MGRLVAVSGLKRRLSTLGSSFRLEEVDVTLADGCSLSLLWKDCGRSGMLETAARIKPTFLYDPAREIEVYRQILAPCGLGPAVHASVADEARDRYWLFLEKIQGRQLSLVGEIELWEQAARWLARLHGQFGQLDPVSVQRSRLLRVDAEYFSRWMDRATRFSREKPAIAQLLSRIGPAYGDLMTQLVVAPHCFLHGEFYASNILVADDPGVERIRPVDWEVAAWGPAALDVATLTAGRWTAPERRAMVEAYLDEEADGGALSATPEEFLREIDLCRLHLAVQWLGWSENWTPPAEHAHDWLGDLRELADRLGR